MKLGKYSDNQILELLEHHFELDSFRDHQLDIIKAILAGDDTLSILQTGSGKSLCYQLPALVMAENGYSTIIIEPIISLMTDQCHRINHYLTRAHIPARAIAIHSQSDGRSIEAFFENPNYYKVIFISPEGFTSQLAKDLFANRQVSLIVIDEAHCVSLWGHDFRPTYSMIRPTIDTYCHDRPIIAAFTATATNYVVKDIINLLNLHISIDGNKSTLFKGEMIRDNLNLLTHRCSEERKPEYIYEYVLNHRDELGIIYCNTKQNVRDLYKYLNAKGIVCGKYYGVSKEGGQEKDTTSLRRSNIATLAKFFDDNSGLSCVIATSAFGMGIDKPTGRDVTYILHYSLPRSMENYYQEVGRAGRHGDNVANCILLYNKRDFFLLKAWIKAWINANPEYTTESVEYQLAMDRVDKMIEYAGLRTAQERNEFIDNYFKNYEPAITQVDPTKYVYLNRSIYGNFLLKAKNLRDETLPDFFDVMVLDALSSFVLSGKYDISYLDILRLLSGRDYFDSKSPLKKEVIRTVDKLVNKEININPDDPSKSQKLLEEGTFEKRRVKNGVTLRYNQDSSVFYFYRQNHNYKMPSSLLGLPNKEQANRLDLAPVPQTKEGLMIKYYLLSKITYCRHLYLTGQKINWSINLSDMVLNLKIEFPESEKGKIAKEKRLMRYIEDYLKALVDCKYIKTYRFATTKHSNSKTVFLHSGTTGQQYNRVNIIYHGRA
ncbi:MAG: RecQ family ATP-dependent DNA helicase [Pseudobutyrivibrio sp.]|nr:RecQ family ATP-dependent DNA helicase [Pseudobutyrivibrio sp.]